MNVPNSGHIHFHWEKTPMRDLILGISNFRHYYLPAFAVSLSAKCNRGLILGILGISILGI
jgi:hypothetical protein